MNRKTKKYISIEIPSVALQLKMNVRNNKWKNGKATTTKWNVKRVEPNGKEETKSMFNFRQPVFRMHTFCQRANVPISLVSD